MRRLQSTRGLWRSCGSPSLRYAETASRAGLVRFHATKPTGASEFLPNNVTNVFNRPTILGCSQKIRGYASYADKQKAKQQAAPEVKQTGSIRDPTNKDGAKGVKKDVPNFAKRRKGYGDPSKVICHLKDLSKILPGQKALFTDISLGFFRGAKVGVLGPNGVGKSSLLKVIAGLDKEYDGQVTLNGDIKVGYLAQEPQLDPTKTVRDNILDGISDKLQRLKERDEKKTALAAMDQKNPKYAAKAKELKDLETELKEEGIIDLPWKVEKAMDALRCPDPDRDVVSLSGGEQRRVALCRLLCSQPDFLLLDEPTNHLDAESVGWLEKFLNDYKGTVLAVTHDRYFLDNVAGWILELDRGMVYPHEGNYTTWLEAKHNRLELEKKKEKTREKQIKQELEWIRTTPKGRLTKNKARIKAFEQLVETAHLRPAEPGTILIPPGPRLGSLVVEASSLSKSFDGRTLIKDLSFSVAPGAIVGIIGPNGVGKTTLLNIIAGIEQPDNGEIRIGSTVNLGFVGQKREELREGYTVYEEISDGEEFIKVGSGTMAARHYVSAFHFKGSAQEKLTDVLSGGERNRVYLAKMLKRGCNVILLDEPTNDLDVDVLRNLENAIAEFAGSVIVVTHDRWFLDRICTHIIAFEGDGSAVYFDGSYGEYMAQRKQVVDPTRGSKFKKLGL